MMNIKKVSLDQQEVLLSWMEDNPGIATGRYRVDHGSNGLERQWSVVARKLNKLGVEKDVKKWQQVWRDWKGNVKKKLQRLKQETGRTHKTVILSPTEHRILALLGEDHTQTQHDSFNPEPSRENTVKSETAEPEYFDESEGSDAVDEVCSWEIPSPAPVVLLDRPRDASAAGGRSPHRRQDTDPLQSKMKDGSPIPPSTGRSYTELEERRLRLRARRLELERRRVDTERRRLQVERAHVRALERLTGVLARVADIAERLETRFLERENHVCSKE